MTRSPHPLDLIRNNHDQRILQARAIRDGYVSANHADQPRGHDTLVRVDRIYGDGVARATGWALVRQEGMKQCR